MPAADAANWFGIAPPDLSLTARAKGRDHIYRFLKTFYLDESKPTGVNNLALANAAMPHVLADLQGLQRAVFILEKQAEGGVEKMLRRFDHFEPAAPGRLSEAEYDAFVNDVVNFLDYVAEPVRAQREQLGIWVVLFLIVFTLLAWALKKEIWKDVH
jgi:ubiquinol-cytochrome c reductase cytochrome c1 subunit